MEFEKIINYLVKNILDFIFKITINFFKFTDYLSKKLPKIKEKYDLKKIEKVIFLIGTLYILIEIFILREKSIFSSFLLFLSSIYIIVVFIDSVDSIRKVFFPVYIISFLFPEVFLKAFNISSLTLKYDFFYLLLLTLIWIFLSLIVKEEVAKLFNKFLIAFLAFILLFVHLYLSTYISNLKLEGLISNAERVLLGIWGLTEFLLELREYCRKKYYLSE